MINNKGYLETYSSKIYYEVHGETNKIPILVINGGPGFSHTYLKAAPLVWEKLSADHPLVFYDQRGTGESSIIDSNGSCTLLDQLNDLEALRKHLGYNQIILLGTPGVVF